MKDKRGGGWVFGERERERERSAQKHLDDALQLHRGLYVREDLRPTPVPVAHWYRSGAEIQNRRRIFFTCIVASSVSNWYKAALMICDAVKPECT
jgi:hypothetical protein